MNSKNNVPEKIIIEYLKDHSIKCTMKDLHVGFARITKIMQSNNIPHRSTAEESALTRNQWYGDPTYNNRESASETKLRKYGDSNYCNTEKIKQTKLERYGNPTYVNPEKAKQTNLQKYGVSCPVHNEEIAEKVKATNIKKYGSNTYFGSESFRELYNEHHFEWEEKAKQTVQNKYGQPYFFMSDYGKEKIKKTIQEKYGVDYFCQTGECRNYSNNSKPNQLFDKILTELNIPFLREFPLKNRVYDFKVFNTLIEINPSATHNSTWSPFNNATEKTYHKDKRDLAISYGYKFIAIWDWDDMVKIASSFLERTVVYARKCVVKEISKDVSNDFLDRYHFQSSAKSSIQLGLYNDESLVSVMTFGAPRYNKNYEYEIIRYCSNSNVVGGAEKLFAYFVDTFSPSSIISYCDFSKFTGSVYQQLGFKEVKSSVPSKHWYNMKTGRHITDNLLRQRGFDALLGKEYGCYGRGTDNNQLMLENGFVEIFDCGQGTYVWKQ